MFDKSSHHSLSDEASPENASVFRLRHSESDAYFGFCHMRPNGVALIRLSQIHEQEQEIASKKVSGTLEHQVVKSFLA